MEKMSKVQLVKYLKENYYDESLKCIDLSGLKFDCNLKLENVEVNGFVSSRFCKIRGELIQSHQYITGCLHQYGQHVCGVLDQREQRIDGDLWQQKSLIKGNLKSSWTRVRGETYYERMTKEQLVDVLEQCFLNINTHTIDLSGLDFTKYEIVEKVDVSDIKIYKGGE